MLRDGPGLQAAEATLALALFSLAALQDLHV